nr:MAG TPA: hypothetical protein [Caudoviricetes sp.]
MIVRRLRVPYIYPLLNSLRVGLKIAHFIEDFEAS